MGKLHVGTADNLYGIHDGIGLLLQPVLHFLGNGQHGSSTEGIAGMNAHGVNILNEADRDHVSGLVSYNLKLKLFPADNALFNEDLAHKRCLKASCAYGL